MSSRSIALAGRIAPPAQAEKPSRRVFGFDPPEEHEAFLPLPHAKAHIEGTSPQSLCACGHHRHAHTPSGVLADDRSWCTRCECQEYKYGIEAKLHLASVNFSAAIANMGAAAAYTGSQFMAALKQVQDSMAAIESQAFIHGKAVDTERIGKLMKLAADISATTGQSMAHVLDGLRAVGAFD